MSKNKMYFDKLDELREGGTMNMFGAPRWLEMYFDLSRAEAVDIFTAWTEKVEAMYSKPRSPIPWKDTKEAKDYEDRQKEA